MDILTLLGVIIGFSALIGGNFLEGGSLLALVNPAAALIVIGGTLGAAILQTPYDGFKRALLLFKWIFKTPPWHFKKGIKSIVGWAMIARKKGLLGLEQTANKEKNSFAQKGLMLLVDGTEPDIIRHVLETELIVKEQRDLDAVQFYESMGGYAPTIGIIGAVLGLIHVMQNLSDPSKLGEGIAVAFVATIYGVALANLFFIPVANKIKAYIKRESQYKSLVIEGIVAIADGENPKAIESKLSGYL